MKPRKHAELIKAWADGAQIQYCHPHTNEWLNVDEPNWCSGIVYRVKPEPKPDFVRYIQADNFSGRYFVTEHRTKMDNVCFTFDGETKELKSVEIIS